MLIIVCSPLQTGFPFDDTDYDSNSNFQDRLNDIAQRHPELAGHLRFDEFPSLRRNRQGSGSSSAGATGAGTTNAAGSASSADPEDLRFGFPSRFGGAFNRFPFSRHFEDDFAEGGREDKPPESPKSKENRGRKPNPNLPQHLSNTVDLGQKQPPVQESRSQRSMSAPPENRSTPTASRVDTEQQAQQPPQEDPHNPSNMGKTFSRQPPKERIIPIHVEGRDEPVVPSNTKYAPPTGAETMFGGERVHTGFASNSPDPQAHIRSQMYDRFMPQGTRTPQREQQQFNVRTTPPRQTTPGAGGIPQPAKQQTPPPPPPQSPPPKQKQATPPPSTKHFSNDPLDKIKIVKNDVLELMTNVEKFQGTRKDKDYLYLDEMLTLNLIKLDDVDTDGKDNIRAARKEAIKCIQTCINNLEAKAQAKEKELKNLGDQSSENMQADQPQQAAEVSTTTESSGPKFTSQATLIIGKPQEQTMESSPSADAPAPSTTEGATPMETAEEQTAPSEGDTNTSQILSTTSK